MKKPPCSLKTLVLSVWMVFLFSPLSMVAGGAIGNSFVISNGSEQEVSPAVAYNSQREEYLAVWYNDRPGNDDVRAQRVSKSGALIGGPFYISAGSGAERRYPDVAYNSKQDQYLVVWEHYDSVGMVPGYGIYGRRVSGTGLVLDATDIVIRGAGGNTYTSATPAVAYNFTTDNYLVVWAETWHPMPIIPGIYGQAVSPTGVLSGSKITISEGTGSQAREYPDVAYNRHANGFLVVWQQLDGAIYDIWSCLVDGDGPPPSYTPQLIAYYTASSTAPAVASLPTSSTANKFLVVFELHYASADRDILGRLVAEDGTPGSAFGIAETYGDESSPDVASSESGNRFAATWRNHESVESDIYGRAISVTGALQNQVAEFLGTDPDHSAIASGPGGDFLVVWQDQPSGAADTNIYGQLWGNRVYMPIVRRN